MDAWSFLDAERPPTANASLWRQSQLNSRHGLYEVTEGSTRSRLRPLEHDADRGRARHYRDRPPRLARDGGPRLPSIAAIVASARSPPSSTPTRTSTTSAGCSASSTRTPTCRSSPRALPRPRRLRERLRGTACCAAVLLRGPHPREGSHRDARHGLGASVSTAPSTSSRPRSSSATPARRGPRRGAHGVPEHPGHRMPGRVQLLPPRQARTVHGRERHHNLHNL